MKERMICLFFLIFIVASKKWTIKDFVLMLWK